MPSHFTITTSRLKQDVFAFYFHNFQTKARCLRVYYHNFKKLKQDVFALLALHGLGTLNGSSCGIRVVVLPLTKVESSIKKRCQHNFQTKARYLRVYYHNFQTKARCLRVYYHNFQTKARCLRITVTTSRLKQHVTRSFSHTSS